MVSNTEMAILRRRFKQLIDNFDCYGFRQVTSYEFHSDPHHGCGLEEFDALAVLEAVAILNKAEAKL